MSCTTCKHCMRKTRIDEVLFEIVCDCNEYETIIMHISDIIAKCDDWEAKE